MEIHIIPLLRSKAKTIPAVNSPAHPLKMKTIKETACSVQKKDANLHQRVKIKWKNNKIAQKNEKKLRKESHETHVMGGKGYPQRR